MNAVLASQPTENWEHNIREDKTTATTKKNYRITETTSIKNDFYYLGIEREKYENLTDILHSTVIAMLYLDSSLYLYMAMPEDTDYQVSYIIINDRKYENAMRPLAVENNYRKYAFQGFKENSTGEYLITEIGFEHPDGGKLIYDTKCTCEMGTRAGQYYFKQSCVNHVVLEGEFIEDQYQFKNSSDFKNVLADLLNQTDLKDTDERSFYYFAFNCYDPQIKHILHQMR